MVVETRTWMRASRLGLLPVTASARALGGLARRAAGADAATVRAQVRRANARDLQRVLGELKGGALKAGQFLSTVDSLLPPDPEASWQSALTTLQEGNEGLSWEVVRPVIEDAIGPVGSGRLRVLDPRPAAAASLGQVHRGVWEDGRDVAVKVQYPGVADAVDADLRVLTAMLRITSLVARGLVVPPVVGELRARSREELDYRTEARHQAAFAAAYASDPGIRVPHVVEATRTVLVSEWVDGSPLVAAIDREDADRRSIALRYETFLLEAPARSGLLHADPHPGNFRVLPDGRLGVLDFGAVVAMPDGVPRAFGRLVRAFALEEGEELLRSLRDAGLVRPGARVDVESLAQVMAPFSEPARHEEFAYSPEWLRSCFDRNAQARDPDYTVALGLTLPAEHLMTQRVWLGCVGTLCRLRATVPVGPVLRRHLPGFAD